MPSGLWTLAAVVSVMGVVIGAILLFSQHYTLDGIKSKTVGDGQHGTARWATKKEIGKTFQHVPFRPALDAFAKFFAQGFPRILGDKWQPMAVWAFCTVGIVGCLLVRRRLKART